MKRLLLVLGVLGGAIALAQSSGLNQTEFKYKFLKYAFVLTNVTQVYFFNGTYSGNAALGVTATNFSSGTYKFTSGSDDYYVSDEGGLGLEKCVNDRLSGYNWDSLSPNIQVSNSAGTNTLGITCKFSPNNVSQGKPNVTGYTSPRTDGGGPTDGELIVITNATNFNIGTSTSGDDFSTYTGMTLKVYPGYVKNDGTLGSKNSSPSWKPLNNAYSTASSSLFTQADAYYTNYKRIRVIPMIFHLEVNVEQVDPITTEKTFTVTWEAAAQ